MFSDLPYKTKYFFAPPELVKQADGKYYIHYYDCPAVEERVGHDPPFLISTINNRGGYTLGNPTEEQCKILEDAGLPRMLMYPADLREKAGSTYHEDIVPEGTRLIYSRPSNK
jgi:hypothetical protein